MNNRSEMNVCSNSCSRPSTDCPNTDPLRGMPLGIGYVPVQEWGQTYCPDKALQRGTIFPPLDLPVLRAASLKDFAVKKEVSHERK